MDLDRDPAKIADAAAEEIRALNHRTLGPQAFTQPGDLSDTAHAIATLVQRLPETLKQMETGLYDLLGQRAIRMDDGTEASARVAEALVALGDAREDLERAHTALQRATGPMSHMGGLWEDDESAGAES